jgi:hypothetical protein
MSAVIAGSRRGLAATSEEKRDLYVFEGRAEFWAAHREPDKRS